MKLKLERDSSLYAMRIYCVATLFYHESDSPHILTHPACEVLPRHTPQGRKILATVWRHPEEYTTTLMMCYPPSSTIHGPSLLPCATLTRWFPIVYMLSVERKYHIHCSSHVTIGVS